MTRYKLLTVGQLIDGTGAPPQKNATILIAGDRIQAVLPHPPADLDESVETHAFPNGTLLPGLIDAHVHLTVDPGAYNTPEFIWARNDDQLVDLGRRQALQFLKAGVTTLRDLGARHGVSLRVRDDLAAGRVTGARVLAAGPAITTVQGHGHFMGVEVANHAELAAAVDQLIATGVDVIKLIGTGGGVTAGSDPLQPQFSAEALTLAVERAHRAGRRVAVHAHSAAGVRNCLDAGVDTIEHCTFATSQGVAPDEHLIARLAEQAVYVIPTLAPWYVLRDSDDAFLGFPQFGLSPRRMSDQVLANLDQMRRAGVKLTTGTDAGTWKLTPARFYDELEGFRQAGFSALETIAAATSVAAQALGIESEVGTIAAGQRADLVIVPGDPTQDFSVLARPALVMQAGKIHPPDY